MKLKELTRQGSVQAELRCRTLRVLLLCSRACPVPDMAEQIRHLLQEGIDWDYLLRLAFGNGVAQLVYWQLNTACSDRVPTAILDTLKAHFFENTERNLLLTGELLKLLALLGGEGIPAVSIKGPVLAASVYGNLSFRRFEDLDLLVRRQDFLRARDLIVSRGYQPGIPISGVPSPEVLRESILTCNERRISVDLTWGITSGFCAFRRSLTDLWRRLRTNSLAGHRVLDLAPEDLLLVLCAHGNKHLWARLGWICDVAELIRVQRKMDWGWIMRQARTLGTERMLLLGVYLARGLLGAELPREAAKRAESDAAVKFLAGQVCRYLFHEAHNPSSGLLGCLFHLHARERLQDRIRYCLDFLMIPTAGDRNLLRLPVGLSFLNYPLRPIRLLGKFALNPAKHLFEN